MFSLQACVLRELKWLEKFSMNGGAAPSYGSFSGSSVSTLTMTAFLPKKLFYQKMWFQVRVVFVGRKKGPAPRDRCFSIFQGDEMKQKENLPPLELWSKIKLFCFKTFI